MNASLEHARAVSAGAMIPILLHTPSEVQNPQEVQNVNILQSTT